MPVGATWAHGVVYQSGNKDEDGNAVHGDVMPEDCLVDSIRCLVATPCVSGPDIIATGDAVLVAPRTVRQQVKHMVDRLTSEGRPEYDHRPVVCRPRGRCESLTIEPGFHQVKRPTVKPGGALSAASPPPRAPGDGQRPGRGVPGGEAPISPSAFPRASGAASPIPAGYPCSSSRRRPATIRAGTTSNAAGAGTTDDLEAIDDCLAQRRSMTRTRRIASACRADAPKGDAVRPLDAAPWAFSFTAPRRAVATAAGHRCGREWSPRPSRSRWQCGGRAIVRRAGDSLGTPLRAEGTARLRGVPRAHAIGRHGGTAGHAVRRGRSTALRIRRRQHPARSRPTG